MTTIDALLDKAADYIDRYGYNKGCILDYRTGSLCAIGAIRSAVFGPPTNVSYEGDAPVWMMSWGASALSDNGIEIQAREILCQFINVIHKPEYCSDGIPEWNDAPERTKEEVTSAMRAAAALYRAKKYLGNPVTVTDTAGEARSDQALMVVA